jgi:hypothetical protein
MGKRANNAQTASKATAKKTKVDPALATITDSIKKAEHLPERCRTMLIDMIPFSLALPADTRLEFHNKVVDMIEETLQKLKADMESGVIVETGKIDDFKSQMAKLVSAVNEAESAVTAQKEVVEGAKTFLPDATTANETSGQVLVDKREMQKSGDAEFSAAQEEKVALEAAYKDHFQVPMDAAEGPHFTALEPFLQKLELEGSLLTALPGTCEKAKDARGTFDNVVLEELEKALSKKIATLSDAIMAGTPAAAERDAAVKQAEAEHIATKEALSEAQAKLAAAQALEAEREADLTKATQAVNELQLHLECCTAQQEKVQSKLKVFETGPLANFMTYKSKTAVPVEAITAGA